MRAAENEKRDWTVLALILLLGLLGMVLAGSWALRFTPLWELDANVESLLDPNSDFLTHKPEGLIEPVDPAILTNAAWVEVYLTPGASLPAGMPFPPPAGTSFATPTAGTPVTTETASLPTVASVTDTALSSPTGTFVYFPPLPSSTPKPKPASTSTAAMAASPTPTATSDDIARFTVTPTPTPTATFTATATATNTQQVIAANPFPSGNIGTSKDGSTTILSPGSAITLLFDTPVSVGGHAGYDLVYYELPAGTGIMMDHVILQIGDGSNWFNILNWGDDVADTNTNLDLNSIGGNESDNRDFSSSPASDVLYNSTGVLIELDGFVPNGIYPYIRIISPSGDDGDGCEVDAMEVLP